MPGYLTIAILFGRVSMARIVFAFVSLVVKLPISLQAFAVHFHKALVQRILEFLRRQGTCPEAAFVDGTLQIKAILHTGSRTDVEIVGERHFLGIVGFGEQNAVDIELNLIVGKHAGYVVPFVLGYIIAQTAGIDVPLLEPEHEDGHVALATYTVGSAVNEQPRTLLDVAVFGKSHDSHQVAAIVFGHFP